MKPLRILGYALIWIASSFAMMFSGKWGMEQDSALGFGIYVWSCIFGVGCILEGLINIFDFISLMTGGSK